MILELKIDYDYGNIQRSFSRKVQKVLQVYYFKRTYLPSITVTRVDKTHKGYHIFMEFVDTENCFSDCREESEKLATIIMQNALGSDTTRSVYDYLRIMKGDKRWNLLFQAKLKNGKYYHFHHDPGMEKKLNLEISRLMKKYSTIANKKTFLGEGVHKNR